MITVEDTWDQLGLRGSGSHDVMFADMLVPHDHAVDLRPPGAWAQPDPAGTAWNTLLCWPQPRRAPGWTSGFGREPRR